MSVRIPDGKRGSEHTDLAPMSGKSGHRSGDGRWGLDDPTAPYTWSSGSRVVSSGTRSRTDRDKDPDALLTSHTLRLTPFDRGLVTRLVTVATSVPWYDWRKTKPKDSPRKMDLSVSLVREEPGSRDAQVTNPLPPPTPARLTPV